MIQTQKLIKRETLLIVASGTFMSFCLLIYQAYDIPKGYSSTGFSLWFRSLAYGILTSLCFALVEWVNSIYYQLAYWKKYILEVWLSATCIFLLFNFFWEHINWSWWGYLKLLLEATGILIFPITLIHIFFEKKSNNDSISIDKSELLDFYAENGKKALSILPENFLYAKSEDNYLRLVFLKNEETSFTLIRGTLKGLAQDFAQMPWKRCHRSYLVNTENITQVERKGQKMYLHLRSKEEPIPVSNTYQDIFQDL